MERLITDESIDHDIEVIDQEIATLQQERDGLIEIKRMRNGLKPNGDGRKPRLKGGKQAYREAVYNALTTNPQSVNQIGERAGVSHGPTMRHLRDLEKAGLARELTGYGKNQRWVRAEVRIQPGQEVPNA